MAAAAFFTSQGREPAIGAISDADGVSRPWPRRRGSRRCRRSALLSVETWETSIAARRKPARAAIPAVIRPHLGDKSPPRRPPGRRLPPGWPLCRRARSKICRPSPSRPAQGYGEPGGSGPHWNSPTTNNSPARDQFNRMRSFTHNSLKACILSLYDFLFCCRVIEPRRYEWQEQPDTRIRTSYWKESLLSPEIES